jgi:hypothetical protein
MFFDVNDPIFISDSTGAGWRSWNIPQSANFVTFIAVGAGGGGGGGRTAIAGTGKGGGGGGGSGSISVVTYQTAFLPESVMYYVGNGGAAGAAGTTGGVGANTYVSLPFGNPASFPAERQLVIARGGNGGVGSTGTGGGAGGAAITSSVAANTALPSMGYFYEWNGLAGATGGSSAAQAGTPIYTLTSFPIHGGSGGGGVTTGNVGGDGGGQILTGGPQPLIPNITGGTSASASGNGADGTWSWKPLCGTGGAGGGGFNGVGGNGGIGAYGCGGGGGGAGTTAGSGGRGGNGLLIILAW